MLKIAKIGSGSWGSVYKAIDTTQQDHKKVAIKRNIKRENVSFCGCLKELDILTKLKDHPFIVTLLDVSQGSPFARTVMSPLPKGYKGYKDDELHFVLELADRNSVPSPINNMKLNDPNNRKIVFLQCLLAIEFMHSRMIMHRDIKPDNILVFDEQGCVKLADFGLSKFYSSQGPRPGSPNMCTYWYRAPEQLWDSTTYSYPIDIWSLGLTFYELIKGTPFMQGANDSNLSIVNKIIEKYPRKITEEELKMLNPYDRAFMPQTFIKSLKTQLDVHDEDLLKMLYGMIEIDPKKRWTATQCIDSDYFSPFRESINEMRQKFPPGPLPREIIKLHGELSERKSIMTIVMKIYENKVKFPWYSDRILFTSVDIFDRFLEYKVETGDIDGYDNNYINIYYLVCLYISVKYHITLDYKPSFLEFLPEEYRKREYILVAEQFEYDLLSKILRNNIYRETVYDSADYYGDQLTDENVEKLLKIYTLYPKYLELTARRIYKIFRFIIDGN